MSTSTAIANPRANRGGRRRVDLRPLYAEWKKLSPNLTAPDEEMSERDLRMWWTNQRLANGELRIASWNDLKPGQARFLLRCMREESGDGPAWRAQMIGRLAQELFGAAWDRLIKDRLIARFQIYRLEDLTPRQGHEFMEELLSRIARRDGKEIEEVRGKFRKANGK